MSDLNQLIQRLCEAEIDFVIVGGFAAMLHGSSLVTRDLDVCAVLTTENVRKLRLAFRDVHPAHRLTAQKLSFLDNPEPNVEVRNLYPRTDIGPVDILSSILGVGDFERVRENAAEIQLFGRNCRVISLDDLIRAKSRWDVRRTCWRSRSCGPFVKRQAAPRSGLHDAPAPRMLATKRHAHAMSR